MCLSNILGKLKERSTPLYNRYSVLLTCLVAFLLPIKLSFAYITLIPSLLLFFAARSTELPAVLNSEENKKLKKVLTPLIFFLLIAGATSFFGLDPLVSFTRLLKMTFFSLVILLFYLTVNRENFLKIFFALLAGQSIAALHSIISDAFPETIGEFFVGRHSESGQIALTLLLAVGLGLFLVRKAIAQRKDITSSWSFLKREIRLFAWALLGLVLFSTLAFSAHNVTLRPFSTGILIFALAHLLLTITYVIRHRVLGLERITVILLSSSFLPLIALTLLINLKRGPWLGVTVACLVLLFLHARKLLLPLIATLIALFFFVYPLRLRLEQSSRDFFIAGGRSIIWEIGADLALRYPLGIGYDNSPILHKFSPEIPDNLVHFHNNVLNVAVESGWLGLLAYLWFIVAILRVAFRRDRASPEATLLNALACAVLSWQIAGLFEYNFGDSEVFLVAIMLTGITVKLSSLSHSGNKSQI